jgi:hypothetical protein
MVRQVEGRVRYGAGGDELFRLVRTMEVPVNEARSRAQFERLMKRMAAEEEAKRERAGRWARLWTRMAWAVSTAAVGAGAVRLLAHY